MKQQALLVGLGQFGMAVARALMDRGVEVLAVDASEERVREASQFVTEAACFDATDEASLARTSPQRRDVCLCAMGDESKEASIVCTALLRQMGARRIIARANDDLHARILTLVGAHQVVNPERDFGQRFANQVLHEDIVAEMPLGDDLLISEVRAPATFFGRTLADLALPARFGVTVVAVRRGGTKTVSMPHATTQVAEGDSLVVVAAEESVAEMLGRA